VYRCYNLATEQLSKPAERRGNFEEVEEGFTRERARKEAERCAWCNLSL